MDPFCCGIGSSSERKIHVPLHGCGILVRWEAGIGVCGKNHGTGLVGDTVIQVCGNIVKELVDCLGSVFDGFGLL